MDCGFISDSYQSVPVDPFAFMHPQKHKLLRRFELVRLCHKQPLEDVAEMPNVELVVEVCCRLSEIGSDLFKPDSVVLFVCYVYEGHVSQTSTSQKIAATHTSSIDIVPRCVKFGAICPSPTCEAPT